MLKAKIDDKSQSVLVNVQCSKEEWQEAQSQAKNNITKTLKVPGFRVGAKIPAHILEKHIDNSKVFNKALEKIISKYSKEAGEAATKSKKTFFTQSSIDVVKFSNVELEFNFVYPFLPDLTGLKFEGVKTKFKIDEFSQQLVEDEINEFLIKLSVMESTKEPAKKTDHVVIDFKGFIDGEPFEGGEAEKYELILGSNQFIPGFEEQLVGKKAGWKGNINVTFPNNYFVTLYRNKVSTFEIFVHEVKRHNIPKLDETMIPMFGFPNVSTIKELKEKMAFLAKSKQFNEAKGQFIKLFLEELATLNTVHVNDALLEPKVKELEDRFNEQLKQNDIKKSEYFELTKTTEQEAKEQIKEAARNEIINQLVYGQLIQRDNYEIKPEDIEKRYQTLSQQYNYPMDQLKNFLKEEEMINRMKEEHLIDSLIKEFDNKSYKTFVAKLQELEAAQETKSKPKKEVATENKGEKTKTSETKKSVEHKTKTPVEQKKTAETKKTVELKKPTEKQKPIEQKKQQSSTKQTKSTPKPKAKK